MEEHPTGREFSSNQIEDFMVGYFIINTSGVTCITSTMTARNPERVWLTFSWQGLELANGCGIDRTTNLNSPVILGIG